jgi:hypothetical protein
MSIAIAKKDQRLVNLTPHDIDIYNEEQYLIRTLPSEGVARRITTRQEVGRFDGIPLYQTWYHDLEDLPDSEEGTMYIVSLLVRESLPGRDDLASPGELIRDASGKPIGCVGLDIS